MNIIRNMVAALLVAGACTMSLAAHAQGQSPVTLSGDVMAVETSIDADGNEKTQLVEPGVIVPGDRLIFGTEYANNGAVPVENFAVTNPLPGAVRLADDADPELLVSVDGGKSWGVLATLTVTDEAGNERSATHADVTHVRWTVASVAPGESGRLEYPAIIR
ncbi:MAG: hypothetical protein ACX930_03950 [Erythrobacter sp.]